MIPKTDLSFSFLNIFLNIFFVQKLSLRKDRGKIQTNSLGYEVFKKKMFLFLFQEDSHFNITYIEKIAAKVMQKRGRLSNIKNYYHIILL